MRLQPQSHMVAAPVTYGCSLSCIWLQPLLPTVAACTPYSCSLPPLRLQPAHPTVAACPPYGCSLHDIRLQEVEYVKQEAKIVYLLECLQKTAPPVPLV